jgi:CheY-like chemotaxis protein
MFVATWLVVEDEDDIRNIVKVMFQVWGHTALEFRDGNEAWTWLDSLESNTFKGTLPELALMDIRMPGHRGHEIAQRIRTVAQVKQIPVVLMTAFSLTDSERQDMLTNYGVDKIINKPLPDFFVLKKILDEVHAKKKAQNEAAGNGAAASAPAAPTAAPAAPTAAPTAPATPSAPPAISKPDEPKPSTN